MLWTLRQRCQANNYSRAPLLASGSGDLQGYWPASAFLLLVNRQDLLNLQQLGFLRGCESNQNLAGPSFATDFPIFGLGGGALSERLLPALKTLASWRVAPPADLN